MASASSPLLFASTLNVYSTTNTGSLVTDSIITGDLVATSGDFSGVRNLTVSGPTNFSGPLNLQSTLDVTGQATFQGIIKGQSIDCIEFNTLSFNSKTSNISGATIVSSANVSTNNLHANTAYIKQFNLPIVGSLANIGTVNVTSLSTQQLTLDNLTTSGLEVLNETVTGKLTVSGSTDFQSVNCTSINVLSGFTFNELSLQQSNILRV